MHPLALRLGLGSLASAGLFVSSMAAAQDNLPPPDAAPQRPVDVQAQTSEGTVRAYGCQRVELDPRTRTQTPPPACPHAAYPPPPPYGYAPYPGAPYPAYGYPGYPVYAVPVVAVPMVPVLPTYIPRKPKYAPDPARTGALVAGSLVFGLGTLAAMTTYATDAARHNRRCAFEKCGDGPSKAALYAMGAFVTVPASLPRYVVGDTGMGLALTGIRAGSFALGAFVDYKDPKMATLAQVMLAGVVPITLSIVDLATTPHREDVQKRTQRDAAKVTLKAIAPTAVSDKDGNPAPALAALGAF